MATSSAYTYQNRDIDYLFHYRADQNLPDETEIHAMAEEMGVAITDYASVSGAVLGVDGQRYVEHSEGAAGKMTNDVTIVTNTFTEELLSVTSLDTAMKWHLLAHGILWKRCLLWKRARRIPTTMRCYSLSDTPPYLRQAGLHRVSYRLGVYGAVPGDGSNRFPTMAVFLILFVFVAPIATGTTMIMLFYTMILYFNSGGISTAEVLSGVNCLLIVAGISILFYGLYRFTLSRVCRNLGLKK